MDFTNKAQNRGITKPVTIRMPIADIEAAQEIAEKCGLPIKPTSRDYFRKHYRANGKADSGAIG